MALTSRYLETASAAGAFKGMVLSTVPSSFGTCRVKPVRSISSTLSLLSSPILIPVCSKSSITA
ncbi:hypothetical protein A2111_01735 [Candidatus Daviesbacteria bacterium GWA1_38_6]|nr:MAG: hypothetical protein A2111_01735 [Candidatus Daviesbacteria bacterium GWA1_38_6]